MGDTLDKNGSLPLKLPLLGSSEKDPTLVPNISVNLEKLFETLIESATYSMKVRFFN